MKKSAVKAALALSCILAAACSVKADPTDAPQYSRSEVKRMIRDAHTAGQYHLLASYFRTQQERFEQQAASEKKEWDRRAANVSGPAAKYPRPVDSSRNRYEYFTAEAQEMDRQASRYESLSTGAH